MIVTSVRCLFKSVDIQCNASILVASCSLDSCLINQRNNNHENVMKAGSLRQIKNQHSLNEAGTLQSKRCHCRKNCEHIFSKEDVWTEGQGKWRGELYLLAIERIAPTSNPSDGAALILRSSSLVSRATFKHNARKSVALNSHKNHQAPSPWGVKWEGNSILHHNISKEDLKRAFWILFRLHVSLRNHMKSKELTLVFKYLSKLAGYKSLEIF